MKLSREIRPSVWIDAGGSLDLPVVVPENTARLTLALGLDPEERASTAAEVATWRVAVAVAALSTLTALLLPDNPPNWLAGAPGLVYFLMNLSWLVSRRAHARSLRRSAP